MPPCTASTGAIHQHTPAHSTKPLTYPSPNRAQGRNSFPKAKHNGVNEIGANNAKP